MSASSSSRAEAPAPRGAALCPHFGTCGGCSVQHLPYPEQVAAKAARVAALLGPLGVAVAEAHPSPQAWHYRNKMEFSFGDVYPPVPGGPTVKLGLKERGKWYKILDLADCRLLSPEAPALLAAVRAWAEREGLAPYNSRKGTGLLRHLVVREAKNGPGRLVHLVAGPGELPRESFLEAVRGAYPATTVLRGVKGSASDTAIPESMEVWDGPGRIVERLRFPGRTLEFRISPLSFFQTNTRGAELLYGLLRAWVAELAPKRVLDLYCGGGGIALTLSDLCESVAGVETNPAAVADAQANAEANAVSNARFYSGQVETLLAALLDFKPEVAVVDPPRAGLHAKALATLAASGPEHLLYVSCNPEALARDLKGLSEAYRAERAEVVDLFPHTEHVETAVRLRRVPFSPAS